jgi:hypothetical protein
VALSGDDLSHVLRMALSAWAADGSVVLSRGTAPDPAARLDQEGVTITA